MWAILRCHVWGRRNARLRVVSFCAIVCIGLALLDGPTIVAAELRVGVFDVDASPPIGSPLAYDPCRAVAMPLRAKGIVLVGAGEPIVLCSVDWIGIANDGQMRWREALARAAGTQPQRVAVHTIHQHDAPFCDFSAEQLLATEGLPGTLFDIAFVEQTIRNVSAGVAKATQDSRVVTHIGLGQSVVHEVASNRRILGDDGKVRGVRYTACRDPDLRAAPEGTIDPQLRTVSFWNSDEPIAVLTYYATHPQSYYLTGVANPDFPGMARELRQVTLNGLPHVHFNGAGGNIGAGKYNDGSPANRQTLAVRLADGMRAAYGAMNRQAITADDVHWDVEPVALPPSPHLVRDDLLRTLKDAARPLKERQAAAADLAWLERCQRGDQLELACLRLGPARVLHMPGETVVEYQLLAQSLRPDSFVAVAAYSDYGPGYICLARHYAEGGYESSPPASRVAPTVEQPLAAAIGKLMQKD